MKSKQQKRREALERLRRRYDRALREWHDAQREPARLARAQSTVERVRHEIKHLESLVGTATL